MLREDVLPALVMPHTEFAKRLGVSRLSVSELLHERALLPDVVARHGGADCKAVEYHGGKLTARMQTAVDLWEIGQEPERLQSIVPIEHRAA